ncbi:hypothetical protein WA1_29320 [Scytonema hofmannii PCC 7110]|uniref:RRXRR domain-containing protein n=1 Tax=Scytonema hofmannii PCC 7110 TaxID=128403 RepID=A0A139X5T4_9CYAN|nr:RRXRR domain-containing protein [Scytonema hofmannii]KYC40059.1 hypothetical protein WA1_29320 [Scytonema hofmannii PCC 7110]
MQNYVFVIDQNKQPFNPVHPARARELLTKQKAAVYRMYPFTIILKHLIHNYHYGLLFMRLPLQQESGA